MINYVIVGEMNGDQHYHLFLKVHTSLRFIFKIMGLFTSHAHTNNNYQISKLLLVLLSTFNLVL